MEQLVLAIHVIISILLIGLILSQQGKGAEVGASFGSGASQTVFGSQGSGNFLTRLTAILVALFFITSLTLSYLAAHSAKLKDLDVLLKKVESSVVQPNNVVDQDIPDAPK
jgi:preprotein translocase subunit SecG